MAHPPRLAVQAGGADDFIAHEGEILRIVHRSHLRRQIRPLRLFIQRNALRTEAEVIGFSADDFQIFEQRSGVFRTRAFDAILPIVHMAMPRFV